MVASTRRDGESSGLIRVDASWFFDGGKQLVGRDVVWFLWRVHVGVSCALGLCAFGGPKVFSGLIHMPLGCGGRVGEVLLYCRGCYAGPRLEVTLGNGSYPGGFAWAEGRGMEELDELGDCVGGVCSVTPVLYGRILGVGGMQVGFGVC